MRLLTFFMTREAQEAGEQAVDTLKQRVFATAFSSVDPRESLSRYYETFEKSEEEAQYDYDVQEFTPQNEDDVQQMLNEVRRAGIIS